MDVGPLLALLCGTDPRGTGLAARGSPKEIHVNPLQRPLFPIAVGRERANGVIAIARTDK